MSAFIELTRTYEKGKTQPVQIKADKVVSFRPRNLPDEPERITRTTIAMEGGQYLNVAEKYSEVKLKLEEAGTVFTKQV